jgi:hypothetical protein
MSGEWRERPKNGSNKKEQQSVSCFVQSLLDSLQHPCCTLLFVTRIALKHTQSSSRAREGGFFLQSCIANHTFRQPQKFRQQNDTISEEEKKR